MMIVGVILLVFKNLVVLTFCGSLTRKLIFLLKINEMNMIMINQIEVELLFFMSILLKHVTE